MQTGSLEVHYAVARLLYIGIPDIPFFWNRPIENLSAGGNLANLQGNSALEQAQTLPDAIAGDASANWIESLNDFVRLIPLFLRAYVFQRVTENFLRRHCNGRRLAHHLALF